MPHGKGQFAYPFPSDSQVIVNQLDFGGVDTAVKFNQLI
jgi:hypothetical protein